jgi:hypothetical protein
MVRLVTNSFYNEALMKVSFFAPILALVLISQAKAWDYNCVDQKVSNHTVNLRVSSDYGTGVWVRYIVDGNGTTIPVMEQNGDNDYISAQLGDVKGGDVEVSIDTLADDDGTNTINLKIKSLGIKGDLGCTAGF